MAREAWAAMVVSSFFAAGAALAQADPNLPLGGGPAGIEGLRLVPLSGVDAELAQVLGADEGQPALRVTFSKSGEERRFLALEAQAQGNPAGARAVAVRYRVELNTGERPCLAVAVFEQGGGCWFKTGFEPVVLGEFTDGRLSVSSLRQTGFSEDESGELEWDRIEKVWFGLLLDGPAEGTFELSWARFTSEPYRAMQPLRVTGEGPGGWSVGQDPAVQSTLTTPDEGPNGEPCMKFEFALPGGRHMYAIPSTGAPPAELEGYRGLRFAYKASIPDGINGLLVMLGERGAQFYADPAPPPSEEWTSVTIPFESFKLGGWSKDDNGRLDLDRVDRVFIGLHGTAQGAQGSGTIWATDVEFVP